MLDFELDVRRLKKLVRFPGRHPSYMGHPLKATKVHNDALAHMQIRNGSKSRFCNTNPGLEGKQERAWCYKLSNAP